MEYLAISGHGMDLGGLGGGNADLAAFIFLLIKALLCAFIGFLVHKFSKAESGFLFPILGAIIGGFVATIIASNFDLRMPINAQFWLSTIVGAIVCAYAAIQLFD